MCLIKEGVLVVLLVLLLLLLLVSLFLVNLIQREVIRMPPIMIAIGGAIHYFIRVKRVEQPLIVFLFLQPALLYKRQETFSPLRHRYFLYHPLKACLLMVLLMSSILSSLLRHLPLFLFHSPLVLLHSHRPSVHISWLLYSLNPSRLHPLVYRQLLRQHLLLLLPRQVAIVVVVIIILSPS